MLRLGSARILCVDLSQPEFPAYSWRLPYDGWNYVRHFHLTSTMNEASVAMCIRPQYTPDSQHMVFVNQHSSQLELVRLEQGDRANVVRAWDLNNLAPQSGFILSEIFVPPGSELKITCRFFNVVDPVSFRELEGEGRVVLLRNITSFD